MRVMRTPALPALSRTLHATGARFAEAAEANRPAAGTMEFTFANPQGELYSKAAVDMVIVPGGDGLFGIMPDHVPTIAELKPGIVSIQETAGGALTKYFVSGGFASMTAESRLTISSLVAVPVEESIPVNI